MLKASPEVMAILAAQAITARECAYSAVTRMELLGFPGITMDEDALIRASLGKFHLRYGFAVVNAGSGLIGRAVSITSFIVKS